MKILVVAKSRKKCEALAEKIEPAGNKTVLAVGKNTAESSLKENPDIGAMVIEPPVLGDVVELISVVHKILATLPIIVLDQAPPEGTAESVKFIPPDNKEGLLAALSVM